ncbi:MAG: 50S ribosomal protein L21e [Candidatus Diapherotrites archaeon]|nr:50S ribosomal protein L21e [Candidatus Diapherotrites archaeon]
MANKKAKGPRAKTRHKLKGNKKRVTVNRLLSKPEIDATVQININSSVHSGMPHPRFHGLTGKVVGYRGRVVEVRLKHGKTEKLLLVHPAHLNILEVENK